MIEKLNLSLILLLTLYVVIVTTYLIVKNKYDKKSGVKEIIIPRGKVAIWFKWMFYSKLLLSSLIAIILPELVIIYYKTFIFDIFALMFINSYAKGDIKKLSEWYKKISAKGKLKRMQK